MARCFIIKGETYAIVPDLVNPACVIDPLYWPRSIFALIEVITIGRLEWIGEEVMFDIHQQQLLVLLLVVVTE